MRRMEFQDAVAIVTGASSGIGLATARRFASAGARVVLFARSISILQAIERENPDTYLAVGGDVADIADIERLFEKSQSRFGPCDVLVNNAGTFQAARVVEMSVAQWDSVFAVNTRAVFAASKLALQQMIPRRKGGIVNVASISGVPGPQKFPLLSSYCASKAAVIAFTESLAVEVKDLGIRVNCVSPGSVDTAMLRRAAPGLIADITPEEIAETILFLASDRSRPVNGQNLHAFSS